jgi:hypothetical protein
MRRVVLWVGWPLLQSGVTPVRVKLVQGEWWMGIGHVSLEVVGIDSTALFIARLGLWGADQRRRRRVSYHHEHLSAPEWSLLRVLRWQ